ncbi:hypothetical protein N7535_005706 [Penicillium sp. DV-2018c]|nr:hypothetical protein N7461_009281 [Penicillium sp. DV-2018c]KAJ5572046.1 hypothetical protein N7535_005706 [Penicillium sp. DV-2018c]
MAEHNWLNLTLKTRADWTPWYDTVKSQAMEWEIWQYINPEVPETALSPLPTKPETPTVSRLREDAKTVLDLSNNAKMETENRKRMIIIQINAIQPREWQKGDDCVDRKEINKEGARFSELFREEKLA